MCNAKLSLCSCFATTLPNESFARRVFLWRNQVISFLLSLISCSFLSELLLRSIGQNRKWYDFSSFFIQWYGDENSSSFLQQKHIRTRLNDWLLPPVFASKLPNQVLLGVSAPLTQRWYLRILPGIPSRFQSEEHSSNSALLQLCRRPYLLGDSGGNWQSTAGSSNPGPGLHCTWTPTPAGMHRCPRKRSKLGWLR